MRANFNFKKNDMAFLNMDHVTFAFINLVVFLMQQLTMGEINFNFFSKLYFYLSAVKIH